ncbi:MAG TPA: DeoR/GlpR family DNA-binding transcription regulator [Planctomycetota bacterium]|nr:DeoR/GlpR family DNA-binding transcription regulator [Planctomycetota bacterium]
MRHWAYRKEKILKHIGESSYASVADLARKLDCSQMTIRRDLSKLESLGLLERSHGGASATRMMRLEFSVAEKAGRRSAVKAAIARAAVELVGPGQKLILDIGTTTLALARELRARQGIAVVTPSLAVVSVLLSAPGVECILLGGTVRETAPDLFGPILEDNLSRIHTDWAFVGCDGISVAGGITASDPRTARSTGLIIGCAAKAALLVDSSKAQSDSFIRYARFEDFDYLITDAGMPAEVLEAARAASVQVITVPAEPA